MIDELIKDKEALEQELLQAHKMLLKVQGALEYVNKKIQEDIEKNKPKPEAK
jgi:hypothetical protein